MTDIPHGAAVPAPSKTRLGLVQAFCAFLMWGGLPLYLKAVGSVPAVEVLAHRVVWSLVFVFAIVAAIGRLGEILPRLKGRLAIYAGTTALISVNWGLFIWAVGQGRSVEASLGYYINPLVNVMLGMLFLGERLNRWQAVSVGLAAVGVTAPLVAAGAFPWISLTLAFSFGFYALLRKRAQIDPLVGLLLETALLTPLALGYLGWLAWQGTGAMFAHGWGFDILLMLSGPLTAIPLILFNAGARHLRLSTIGLMQYLAPSLQLILAIAVFHEAFTFGHAVTFAFIWAALAVYTWDALRR